MQIEGDFKFNLKKSLLSLSLLFYDFPGETSNSFDTFIFSLESFFSASSSSLANGAEIRKFHLSRHLHTFCSLIDVLFKFLVAFTPDSVVLPFNYDRTLALENSKGSSTLRGFQAIVGIIIVLQP